MNLYSQNIYMLKKIFKSFVSFIIVLHCMGATQLLSAYSKDYSAFVGMLNMTEEETKKEKESKEDSDYSKDIRQKISSSFTPVSFTDKRIYFGSAKSRVTHQFVIEHPSPPPDSKG